MKDTHMRVSEGSECNFHGATTLILVHSKVVDAITTALWGALWIRRQR